MVTTEVRLPAHLLSGPDPVLLAEAFRVLLNAAVGDGDRTLLVDELSGEDYSVEEVVDAAQTPAFLTDRRIVVARSFSRFNAGDLGPLIAYLGDPAPTTELIVEWGPGRIPKALVDAVLSAGGSEHKTGAPANARGRRDWYDEQFAESAVELDRRARQAVIDQLGEDVGRLSGLLATLASAFGSDSVLGLDEVEPYLGDVGAVPPWELTDAVDQADLTAALGALGRMLDAGGRHPLQLMATLHGHFERMLRLDGCNVADDKAAAIILGMKGSTFPAKKALTQGRRLGSEGVRRAIELLADADLDLRGRTGLEGRYVLEVLVGRLALLRR